MALNLDNIYELTDDEKTLHFTNDKVKGVLIETKRKDGKCWWYNRFDLFEKEIYTN